MIWKQLLYNFMVLLNGPVQNALFCLMDRYRNVCVWFMGQELPVSKGWNSRLPTWEPQVTIASNCRLPEVGTHASQPGNHRLPLQKNFRFLKVGTDGSQRGNQRLPWQGTAGSQTLKLTVPNLGTRGYHCKEIAGSPKLEFMFSKLNNYHCKELPVAKAWTSWFQTWKSIRYQWKDLLIPKS